MAARRAHLPARRARGARGLAAASSAVGVAGTAGAVVTGGQIMSQWFGSDDAPSQEVEYNEDDYWALYDSFYQDYDDQGYSEIKRLAPRLVDCEPWDAIHPSDEVCWVLLVLMLNEILRCAGILLGNFQIPLA